MHNAKKGDPRYMKLHGAAQALNSTPVSILEEEASKFGLSVEYSVVEERKATKLHPKLIVIKVCIETKESFENNEIAKISYEAIGHTSREAKFKVAEAALIKLKTLTPGMQFAPGEVPPIWNEWAMTNIEMQVLPRRIIKKLRSKGFSPGLNTAFMQQFSLRLSSCFLFRVKISF